MNCFALINEIKIKNVLYVIFACVFTVFIVFPVVFQYVGPYSAPTSVYGLEIIKQGRLVDGNFITISSPRAHTDILMEISYPLPSLLAATFTMVTGIPPDLLMFLPLSGVASIIFFVLARRILSEKIHHNSFYIALFPLFYFFFTMSSKLFAEYSGRATLGAVLLAFFVFCYSIFLYKYLNDGQRWVPWFIFSCLFTVAIGFTYYSSTLAIVLVSLVTAVVPNVINLLKKRPLSYLGIGIFSLSCLLFAQNFFSSIGTTLVNLNFDAFLNNFWQYVTLRQTMSGNSQLTLLYSGLVQIDPLTNTLKIFYSFITILSMLAILFAVIRYKPKIVSLQTSSLIWLFSIISLIAGISEFAYLSVAPSFPTRFFALFGLIIPLYFLSGKVTTLKLPKNHLKKNGFKLLAILLVSFLTLGSLYSLRSSWYYGIAGEKPYAYSDVLPASNFVCTYSSINLQQPMRVGLVADANFAANIFFIASLHNQTNNIVSEPIEQSAIPLYQWLINGSTSDFFVTMNNRGMHYLFVAQEVRPLWGDTWGYSIPSGNTDRLETRAGTNLIYDNGYSQLYGI